MSSRLDTLRMSFDRMNMMQKKSFIAKLQIQSNGNNNPELTKFLNECIKKYNMELQNSAYLSVSQPNNSYIIENPYDTFDLYIPNDLDNMQIPQIVNKTMNTMALIGFILGCVSLFLNFGGIVGILACVFSGIGLGKFDSQCENNKWMAITGLILGIISILWVSLTLILLLI